MRVELAAGPETNDALRSQKTVNPKEDAVFFELYDEDTAGWRPARTGSPPHRWADRRVCARGADPRLSGAADWWALEIPAVPEQVIVQTIPETYTHSEERQTLPGACV